MGGPAPKGGPCLGSGSPISWGRGTNPPPPPRRTVNSNPFSGRPSGCCAVRWSLGGVVRALWSMGGKGPACSLRVPLPSILHVPQRRPPQPLLLFAEVFWQPRHNREDSSLGGQDVPLWVGQKWRLRPTGGACPGLVLLSDVVLTPCSKAPTLQLNHQPPESTNLPIKPSPH